MRSDIVTRKYLDLLAAEMAAAVVAYGPRSVEEVRACCGAWASEHLPHLADDERRRVMAKAVTILANPAGGAAQPN